MADYDSDPPGAMNPRSEASNFAVRDRERSHPARVPLIAHPYRPLEGPLARPTWQGRVCDVDLIWEQVVVDAIKPQKSNVSFPSVLGGPMSGRVTRRGWYSLTLKAMSSASFLDGFGPMFRSR